MNNKSEYWIALAEYDMETAKGLLQIKRYLYVGFMCHQTIEKALKAVMSNANEDEMIPKIHNLLKLAVASDVYSKMSEGQRKLLERLLPLNIESRYPSYKENISATLNNDNCKNIVSETEALLCWIKQQL